MILDGERFNVDHVNHSVSGYDNLQTKASGRRIFCVESPDGRFEHMYLDDFLAGKTEVASRILSPKRKPVKRMTSTLLLTSSLQRHHAVKIRKVQL